MPLMRPGLSALAVAAAAAAMATASPASAAPVTDNARFTASDGVSLQTTLTGEAPLAPRPTIVEFSPYGRDSGTFATGPDFNFLLVQIRGTGDSDGQFDALGPRTQMDVAEVLNWACGQPWSDGNLGINGFSASTITIYNSLHLQLPCVRAAVLKSGTFELYRDLLYPGGVSNLLPGTGVLATIGAPALAQGGDRLARNPASSLDTFQGLTGAGLSVLEHPTLDAWWRERGFRGDVNHLPILMIDGFYDVESRGAFQAFQELRGDGAHLTVIGAHDGAPAGTDGGTGEAAAWFDHYLRGIANGVDAPPKVKLWMADGDREDLLAGKFVRYDGEDWPIPGTRWESLAFSAEPSGTASSLNDGTLDPVRPADSVTQSYPALPSLPESTDPHNTAIVGGFGFNALADALPSLTEMALAEPLGLSYTTAPLDANLLSAGPASLELRLSSTAPETAIWAVLSDVFPDGTAHPVTSGRLLSSYPDVDAGRSLTDPQTGEIVQPYGNYSAKTPAAIGESRLYRVELWPVGNRFKAGHRLRLDVLGASAASLPSLPALNTIAVGGPQGSRLLLPVLP
jgi:putative CocE/NonD family hydrolase